MKLETLEPWVSRVGKDHIFRSPKRGKCVHTKLRTLEPRVSQLGKNRIFKPPKCRKWVRTKLRTLEPWVSRLASKRIFKAPKCTTSAQTKLGTLEQWGSWLGINRIFRPPKCRKRATGPLEMCFLRNGKVSFPGRPFQMRPVSFVFDLDLWPWPRIWAFAWPLNFELELKLLEFQPPRASL